MVTSDPRWHPEALADAENARDWYAARSPLAARGFLRELETAVEAIREAPERWPVHEAGTRRRHLSHRYPYAVIYRAGPPIVIVAVAHAKRRPRFWAAR